MPSSSFYDDYIAAVRKFIAALFLTKNELYAISVEILRHTITVRSILDIFYNVINV